MKVSLDEIRGKFNSLINEDISREAIAEWAYLLRIAQDTQSLDFETSEARSTIWKALLYLEGVDLRDSPDTYLHTLEDFKRKKKALNL